MPKFSTPRGTRDFLPGEMAVRNHVEKVFRSTFQLFGFQQIQTPVFEEFALLAARSGDEIRESMFTFISDRIEYALRPEMTAPVCRLVAMGSLAHIPLPYKLYYIGQCFQYRRLQPGTYREFRQAGVELLGSREPLADAEVITAAVSVLKRLGINAYELKVGHIGIFRAMLAACGLDFDAQTRVIGHLDRIQRVRERCADLREKDLLNREDMEWIKSQLAYLFRIQDEIDYRGQEAIVPSRDYREDAAAHWMEYLPLCTEKTIQALWSTQNIIPEEWQSRILQISRVRGPFQEALACAAQLVAGSPSEEALANLRKICNCLERYRTEPFQVVLGMTRGFDFYTGMVFEIDSPLLGAQRQICGGGRYDRLVSEFDGPNLPATGFAFSFDRVVELFLKSGHTVDASMVDVALTISDPIMVEEAVELTVELRERGVRVSFPLMPETLREQHEKAKRTGCRYIVVLTTPDACAGICSIHDVAKGTEKPVPLGKVVEYLTRKMKKKPVAET